MLKFLNYKLAAVLLFVLVAWLGFSAWQARVQSSQVTRQAQELEGNIRDLEQENDSLTGAQDYYKSAEYLDRQARLKLNFKSPGEDVVFVYKNVASGQPEPLAARVKTMANWRKWWYYLLGK